MSITTLPGPTAVSKHLCRNILAHLAASFLLQMSSAIGIPELDFKLRAFEAQQARQYLTSKTCMDAWRECAVGAGV